MSDNFFINRHGRKSDVEPIIIQNPEITADPVKKKRQWKAPKVKIPRVALIITSAVVLAVLAGFFLLADALKRDLQLQATTMKTSVQTLSTKTASTETAATQAARDLVAQLNAVTSCTSPFTFLTNVYSPARTALDECRTVANKYDQLKESLNALNESAQYLEKEKTLLAPALALPAESAFAEIPSEVSLWQTASDELQELVAPEALKASHTALLERVKAVASSWKELQVAFDSQSTEQFTAAETKVTKTYEALRQSGADFQAIIDAQQQAILDAQKALD